MNNSNLTAREVLKGQALYDDGFHKFVWLGWQEEEEEGLVQVNQYLIVNGNEGVLLDPGGIYVFPQVVANVSRWIDLDNIKHIFYTHQDPDVSSGIALWLNVTPAKVYISKLWVRFLPHFGVYDKERVVPIEDGGGRIKLSSGDYLEIIPAHYLHSEGNHTLYDPRSKILFSGDVGAAVFPKGQRYVFVENFDDHVRNMEGFHRRYMVSNVAIRKWLSFVRRYDVETIAPQHGAIFKGREMSQRFLSWLENLKCGVDIIDSMYGG